MSTATLIGGLVERGVRLWAEGEQLRLRAEPGECADYAAVKAELASSLASTTDYAQAKEPWFDSVHDRVTGHSPG